MSTEVNTEHREREWLKTINHTWEQHLDHRIDVLYDLLKKILGVETVAAKIQKLNLTEVVESKDIRRRVYALQRLVFRNEEHDIPDECQISRVLSEIEEGMADLLARVTIETRLEQQAASNIEKRQREYMDEIKLQLLQKKGGPENANTLRKYAVLEKLERVKLSKSAMDMMRPQSVEEIVGQDRAVKALMSKLATPYPQHVIIYGPPGVGKTTAARLVLEMAKRMKHTPFRKDAPFVEVDGTTLRWDPREITNPLLGAVHDPIYQGSKRELAETGIPEPKTGLVTEAHGGVLFIDEIGELDIFLQNKLLKVLEDKRVHFDSSYYDPYDENVPKYVKKLFDEGAPADFILIGATTREPGEINPALRSRCAEVFFDPLKPEDIRAIVASAATRIQIEMDSAIPDTISRYTVEGRKAVNLLTDTYGMALHRRAYEKDEKVHVSLKDLEEVIQISRLTPVFRKKGSDHAEIGKILGLGVHGFLGKVLELEAVTFHAEKGRGRIWFNDTAGSMAKDSVSNAATVLRRLTGKDLYDYDIHVNSIGGGNIDGPSAGVAILLVILSALEERPLRQDVAVTGEISIRGRIMPVGGIQQKIYTASQSGIRTVIIPRENEKDVPLNIQGMNIVPVDRIEQAVEIVFR